MEKSLPHTETKPKPQKSLADGAPNGCPENGDSGYGKDIKGRLLAKPQKNNFLTYRIYLKPTVKKKFHSFFLDIPRSMWRLVTNPVYVVTCLGACMELVIVSGFVVFLPKYLETQFSLGKSQASIFTGNL